MLHVFHPLRMHFQVDNELVLGDMLGMQYFEIRTLAHGDLGCLKSLHARLAYMALFLTSVLCMTSPPSSLDFVMTYILTHKMIFFLMLVVPQTKFL